MLLTGKVTLISGAGRNNGKAIPALEIGFADWRQAFAVNVHAFFLLAHAVASGTGGIWSPTANI